MRIVTQPRAKPAYRVGPTPRRLRQLFPHLLATSALLLRPQYQYSTDIIDHIRRSPETRGAVECCRPDDYAADFTLWLLEPQADAITWRTQPRYRETALLTNATGLPRLRRLSKSAGR
jgi:hypothetical protein